MQDQIVKKFKDSLNKSTENYQHQSHQFQGGMNNISSNYNSNTNQINSEITNSQLLHANYQSNKLKQISSSQVHQNISDIHKQKTEITNTLGINQQEHSNSKLTNKLTQNIKNQYNENEKQLDTSNQKEYIQKFQEYSLDQNISKQKVNQSNNYVDVNECERLGTELVDEDDNNDEENNYTIPNEYLALIKQEHKQQEMKLMKQGQELHQINDQQLQEQIYQQQLLLQQQQLSGLQPGDFRIEIENRYYKSECNRTFKFPRNLDKENKRKYNYDTEYNSSNDSSINSVDGVTVYNLHAQNMKNYQREYMEMQEQTNDQMEKFKIQEQLRLQKEEEEIIEKERIQHQLRQQKIIQQQVYVQHQYGKHNNDKKNEQVQQLREQLQTQQSTLQQMQKGGGIDIQQVVKTETYDSQNFKKNTIHTYLKNQQQSQQVKNIIDLTQYQNPQINQQNQDQNNLNINLQNKTQYQLQQQQIAQQKMKLSSSTDKQNNKQKQQLQKFKNILLNKQQQQQQIQKNNKPLPHENSRRMKTEGNDIEFEQNSFNHQILSQNHNFHAQNQNLHNLHHKLHTQQHNFPTQNCEYFSNEEEDETIENFEEALQDGSDNDSGEIARLDDIKIQSYKQTISPSQKNNKSNYIIQNNTNQDTIGSKNYKNLMEILEKNSKTSHSRQSTTISNNTQIGQINNCVQNTQGHQKKYSHNSNLQTVQIQIQQQPTTNTSSTINPSNSQVSKNMIYKSRPTTSQQNRNKNQYPSQNCSINMQSSNRNTIQVQDNLNTSKIRQQSKTSHSNYENAQISTGGGKSDHLKNYNNVNISQSIEGPSISSRQQSLLQTQKNLLNQQGQVQSRKRSTSNKNNSSANMNTSSSLANNNKPTTNNSSSQKSNLKQIINYSKHLDNFKIDNLKSNQVKVREEKVSSKAPSSQQQITGLLNNRSFMNSNTNNSFQMTKNTTINNGTQNKMNCQNNQNSAKLKARNSNSFHQNMQSSNALSIHSSQTTNFNNKSTIVSNYSQNSNSKKRLLSSSSSTNLINAHGNNQIKNDSSQKQTHSNNQILSLINTNVNTNNLNPTNYSKVRMSTNSNARDSIQSQKSNGINSRVQTEPSNNEEEVDINYLQTRLSTITKIPSKQSLLNNKSTARRKDNSGSKQNLRDQLLQQEQNYVNQKSNQVMQSQALQGLMINNQYNCIQQKSNDHILNNLNQAIGKNSVKHADNQIVKTIHNQQPQTNFNLKCHTEQSTSEMNDQNKQNSQNLDQIQKIKEYLKQKSSKYPMKQNSISNNQNQYQQINGLSNQGQQMILQSSQVNQHYPSHTIQQSQITTKQSQHQTQFQNYNHKGDNQLHQQQNSQFNSNIVEQQTNSHYFQKQIR